MEYYLNGIQYSVDIIDLIKTYESMVIAAHIIYDAVLKRENIFFCCSKQLSYSNVNYVVYPKWIPGTLTNRRHVIHSYGSGKIFNIHLIISMNVSAYSVISREIMLLSGKAVKLVSLVDTNVRVDMHNSYIRTVMMNDESYYCSIVFYHFVNTCINLASNMLMEK